MANQSFYPFVIGEVRDFQNDPTKSGRCKVRLYHEHNDEERVKDDDLPWASVLHPVTSAATAKIGISPSGLKVGSRVLCMFMPWDTAKQYPIILGSLGRGDKAEGQQKSTGGVSKQSQDAQKNSGGKISKAGVDNPASDGKSPQ